MIRHKGDRARDLTNRKRSSSIVIVALISIVCGMLFAVPTASFAQRKPAACGASRHVFPIVGHRWLGASWNHTLIVSAPDFAQPPRIVLLELAGRAATEGDLAALDELACRTNSWAARLDGVPNQPLLSEVKPGGLRENDLLAYSFREYRRTGDEEWPLLRPMVAAARAAMTYMQEELGAGKFGFVVFGTSKRGWTALLTAAQDPRVRGVAAVSYDNLDIPRQIDLMKRSYGETSEKLRSFKDLGLLESFSEPRIRALLDQYDPYEFRDRLTMPKLFVVGANDPYWTADSMGIYYADLPPSKSVVMVPNAGHDPLHEPSARGELAAWAAAIVRGEAPPELHWSRTVMPDGRMGLVMRTPTGVRAPIVWTATSSNRDFRESTWAPSSTACRRETGQSNSAICVLPASDRRYRAVFGAADVSDSSGRVIRLTTDVFVQEPVRFSAGSRGE